MVKEIAITENFEVDSKSKTKRKLELEEIVEVLEGPKVDEATGMTRVRGKSLSDGTEGWITIKGNQGTPFLHEVEKPFYALTKEVPLEKDAPGSGAAGEVIRTLMADEVVELIEGPKKEKFPNAVRVRGKVLGADPAVSGWLTLKDKRGIVYAELAKFYVCTSSVAITDAADIKACKVVRKLAEGEVFVAEGEPIKDAETGISRLKCKLSKDDLVGWVTLRGNAGTVYAEESTKHYKVLRDAEVSKRMKPIPAKAGAKPVAEEKAEVTKAGQIFEAAEAPREDVVEPEVRVKGRVLGDGKVGWMVLVDNNVKAWTPVYKCVVAASMQDARNPEGAAEVREVKVGEVVEIVEGPVVEGKLLRMKGRAGKDSITGWMTITDGDGKKFFRSG